MAYAHGHHESVLRSHAVRTVADSAAYLVSSLSAGTRILDVGAGPGSITVDLADRVFPGRVVGVDAAPDVVEVARATAGERTNVEFRVGDAYALDAPDASFDIVHAHQTLQHLERPVDALREFRRVAGPDGLVAVRDVDYGGVIWHPLIPALDEWLEIYHGVHRGSSGEPDAGRRLKAWAREAGFTRIEASASVWVFDTPDKRAWWGGMWADRALASAFAGHAKRLGLADDAQLERISDAWREWAAHPDGWILLPHGEVLARG
ncbi:methyltransferase domain-containing protein [Microbacterium proteolyticum]|uniref:methyltransferase domain-containing protein n=1 Tax=Microbacterium proteolyticum TaxID=1572644 RepID=UPI001FABFB36|nr:methyltransferase domain-containing protein [Microbacterium proteolyticum]MCI9856847.1 methyltransferase domain-containing protein [Microbacterium proteolyticum]